MLARQPPVCHPCRTETAVRPEAPGLSPATAYFVAVFFRMRVPQGVDTCYKCFTVSRLIGGAMHSVYLAALPNVAERRGPFVSLQRVLVPLLMDEPTSGNFGLDGK